MSTETPSFTQLDAVNGMLLMVKEQPVASLEELSFSEAYVAKEVLKEVQMEILSEGWTFNRLTDVNLPVNNDSKIPLPVGTLEVESFYSSNLFIERDGYLFNVTDNTDEFSGSQKVNLTLYYPFGELPLPIRIYIYKVACKNFEKRIRDASSSWLDEEISRAKSRCAAFDLRQGKPLMVDNYRHSKFLDKWNNTFGGKTRS